MGILWQEIGWEFGIRNSELGIEGWGWDYESGTWDWEFVNAHRDD